MAVLRRVTVNLPFDDVLLKRQTSQNQFAHRYGHLAEFRPIVASPPDFWRPLSDEGRCAPWERRLPQRFAYRIAPFFILFSVTLEEAVIWTSREAKRGTASHRRCVKGSVANKGTRERCHLTHAYGSSALSLYCVV